MALRNHGRRIQIKNSGVNSGEPMFIVDGKEVNSIANIDADRVESISVLKNKEHIEKYGKKAVNGVVIISLKEK